MNTIKLYHGTNANPLHVMDSARMTKNINGYGFYLTNDIEVARKYGRHVVCFELSMTADVKFTVRPIDQSYTIGLRAYDDCVLDGQEWVITDTRSMNNLILDCENSYEV